jgi:hypothetical protein
MESVFVPAPEMMDPCGVAPSVSGTPLRRQE